MANYANLKAAIASVIYDNENNEITGLILQQALLAMINSLGDGYQFVGFANPSTIPGTPDNNVFYIAGTPGTYVNFGGFVLPRGAIAVLKYNGSWTSDTINSLGGVASDLYTYVLENGWHVVDEERHIAVKYDEDGFDVAKLSAHFLSLIGGGGGGGGGGISNIIEVYETGFYIVDSSYNVGFSVDVDGAHAKNIVEFEIDN